MPINWGMSLGGIQQISRWKFKKIQLEEVIVFRHELEMDLDAECFFMMKQRMQLSLLERVGSK